MERVEDVLVEIAATSVADARLRGWINHGDERVPLALIIGPLAPWLAQHEGWSLHLYARAMRDAERDGVCWSPLLDQMAVAGIWPTGKGRVVLGGKVSVVTPLSVPQVLEPLRLWLREQTDGAVLAPLAAFHASPVRALVRSRLAVLPAVASFTGEYPSQRAEAIPAEQRVTTATASFEVPSAATVTLQTAETAKTPVANTIAAATTAHPLAQAQAEAQAQAQPSAGAPLQAPAPSATSTDVSLAAAPSVVAASGTNPAQAGASSLATPGIAAPATPAPATSAPATAAPVIIVAPAIGAPGFSPHAPSAPAVPMVGTPAVPAPQVATSVATAPSIAANGEPVVTGPPVVDVSLAVAGTPAPDAVSTLTLHPTSAADHAGFPPSGDRTAAATAMPVVERRYTAEQVAGLLNLAAQATGRGDETQVRPEVRRAIDLLIEYRALGSDNLYSLYSACRKVRSWVVRIVSHVSATIELWRAALRDNNWLEVREAIVASTVARRDSVIRLILSRCGSSDVLCALCRDGDLPDVSQIARRVLRVDPRGLLDALHLAAATTGLRLAATDLMPLVQHEEADVRQRAVSLLQLMVRTA